MSKISKRERVKWDVFKLVLIPLFIGAYTPIYSPIGNIAFAAILPILGFMILYSLIHTREFKTNFQFTAAFIFLFSLAAGAVAGIGKFMSDRFLDTRYLPGNDYLMVELLVVMLFGLLGVLIFIRYRNKYHTKTPIDLEIGQFGSKLRIKEGYSGKHFFKLLKTYFWGRDESALLLSSKVLQGGILYLVFYNFILSNFWALSIALPSFIFSIFPSLYSRFLKIKVSPSFQFWLSGALFLYSAGETLRFQSMFGLWNELTHFMGGVFVGVLILIYLLYLKDISDNLHISSRMIPFLVLIFMLAGGVLWEVFEFLIDSFFGTGLQPNLQDTICDMIFNTIGTFFALIIASVLTPLEVFSSLRRKNKISRWKQNIIAHLNEVSLPSFGFTSGIIALSFAIWRSDWIWSIVSSVFVVLVFGISKVSRKKKIKWNVFLLSLIPLFFGAIGIPRVISIYRIVGDLALGVMIPFLSLMIVLNLIYYTRFKTNFQFTIFLMFIFSLSLGALLGITKFLSDFYLNSQYLISVELLMREFAIITISTLIGIGLLIRHLIKGKDKVSQIIIPLTSKSYLVSESPKEDFLSLLNSFFGKRLYHDFPWITKALPFAIIPLIILAVYTSNLRAIAVSLPALAFSIIPYVSKQGVKKSIPNSFQFWFSIILLIFLIGEILRVYPRFEWWTLVTHLVAGMIITLLVFLGFLYIDQSSDPLEIPLWMIPMLSLTTLSSVIFLEKLSLFTLDILMGTSLLGSLNYTVLDIMAALIGGGFVLQLIKLEETI